MAAFRSTPSGTHKISRLQKYGLQITNLTSYFYKNIYLELTYVYFYEVFSTQIYSCSYHISNSTT
jgi:hypothetical protein